jgi:hypothetical protein
MKFEKLRLIQDQIPRITGENMAIDERKGEPSRFSELASISNAMYMAGESLASNARRALPIRNRFTKPSKEKPFSVGMASSPSKTNLFGK